MPPKVLIAGIGNELRQDDAFGIEFVRLWQRQVQPTAHIQVMEVGIGGIHLVQELHNTYDILIMADAMSGDEAPGTLYLREVTNIGDLEEMPTNEMRAFLADMHYTNPTRALMLAKALGVLPPKVYLLGCRSAQHDDFAIGMSEEVSRAVPKAVKMLREWLASGMKVVNTDFEAEEE